MVGGPLARASFDSRAAAQTDALPTLQSNDLGPNATLSDDREGLLRKLKAEREGEIEIAGTLVAQSATELGLIDEYRIYLHPVVLGGGKPFFAAPPPALRLVAHEQIDDGVIRLTYVPAVRPSP
jgi:dihydrofolate reductase